MAPTDSSQEIDGERALSTRHQARLLRPRSCYPCYPATRCKNCRTAHARTHSGTNSVTTTTLADSICLDIQLCSGPGILGWTVTQTHAKMVAMQLVTMLTMVLHLSISLQVSGIKSDEANEKEASSMYKVELEMTAGATQACTRDKQISRKARDISSTRMESGFLCLPSK